jgi:hypothetical protein
LQIPALKGIIFASGFKRASGLKGDLAVPGGYSGFMKQRSTEAGDAFKGSHFCPPTQTDGEAKTLATVADVPAMRMVNIPCNLFVMIGVEKQISSCISSWMGRMIQ